MPQSINSAGIITGYYADTSGTFHGFLRSADGHIHQLRSRWFNIHPSDRYQRCWRDNGDLVDSAQLYHGFVRAADGTITTFLVRPGQNTQPASINDSGAVTGTYGNYSTSLAFSRAADGTISTFAPKNAYSVVPTGINNAGKITGFYEFTNANGPGFVRRTNGSFATFNLPGVTFMLPLSINSAGEVTGYYQASVFTAAHGFLLYP